MPQRFQSIDDLIRKTGIRRDEITVLAEIGALNSLGYDRRGALWQVERAVRTAGELFATEDSESGEEKRALGSGLSALGAPFIPTDSPKPKAQNPKADEHPLSPMSPSGTHDC